MIALSSNLMMAQGTKSNFSKRRFCGATTRAYRYVNNNADARKISGHPDARKWVGDRIAVVGTNLKPAWDATMAGITHAATMSLEMRTSADAHLSEVAATLGKHEPT